MASSVWTATVWGQGKAAILAATNRKIQPGEEECHICKDDVPASVSLKPCGHMICFGCVENLRAKNIFRADKGVKCPFCRQYVTQYEPCNSADPEQVRLLNEANRAAAFARAGRASNGTAAAPGSGAAGGAAAAAAAGGAAAGTTGPSAAMPAEDSWMCGSCRCLNLAHREECSICSRPNPRPKTVTTRSRDVLKCSDEEVIGFLQERHQPNLQRCFTEVGLGFSTGRLVTDSLTPQRILNAFKQRGQERMLRLVGLLGNPAVFYECATHFMGNYGLQSLVEATMQIRKALELAPSQGQHDDPLASFRSSHAGRDPHAVLLYGCLPHAAELATHEKANYLIQKLADHADAGELVELCGSVFPQGPTIVRDAKGVYVLNKLLSMLKTTCADGASRFDACELCDALCCAFMEAPDKLKFCLHNSMASKVLTTAIALGLPQYGALQLGSRVATAAAQLASSKYGVHCVMSMLEMESSDPMCLELVRDLLCTVAMQLQGGLVGLLLSRTCLEKHGPALVRTLLRRLAEEQEVGWLDAICQELVNYGDVISEDAEALDVVKEAFCSNILDDDTVLEHLLQLRQVVPEAVMPSIEEDVCGRRDANLPPPPPRYHNPSVLQPHLKYCIARGHVPEPPPLPPSRDGSSTATQYGFYGQYGTAASGGYGAGRGGPGRGMRGRGGRGRYGGGRGSRAVPAAPSTWDESFFAEGLHDPSAPIQDTASDFAAPAADNTIANNDNDINAGSGTDVWATPSSDPWGVSSTGEWCEAPAAEPPAATAAAEPPPVLAPPAPAPVASSNTGLVAGQMLLQSLQRPLPPAAAMPAPAPAPPAAAASPVLTVPAANGHTSVPVVAVAPHVVARPLVPPNPALQRPAGHAVLPLALATNPTLVAARAVAQAAIQAQQVAQQAAAAQQQQQAAVAAMQQLPQPQQPQQVAATAATQQQSTTQQVLSQQPVSVIAAGTVHHAHAPAGVVRAAEASPPPQQQHPQQQQQPQQQALRYPQIPVPGAAPVAVPSTIASYTPAAAAPNTTAVGAGAVAVPSAPAVITVPYMATGAPRPPTASAAPYPLALFNPALAVLNNTAGIAAFAPRLGATRPIAVPQVAQPPPPLPSASLATAAAGVPASSSGNVAANAAAAAAASAAAARRMVSPAPPATAPQPAAQRPPPAAPAVPPAAAEPPPSQPRVAGTGSAWQCQICTYDHKGFEAQFLACAICGCERGLQQLPA